MLLWGHRQTKTLQSCCVFCTHVIEIYGNVRLLSLKIRSSHNTFNHSLSSAAELRITFVLQRLQHSSMETAAISKQCHSR